jgi:two-component system, chemotaxis family, chemotaxis protein CheY
MARVLVIEDVDDIREAMVAALADAGHQTSSATDGRAALDLFESGVSFDVVILDLHMPVMNGETFLLEWRKRPDIPKSPVVICSAWADLTRLPGAVAWLRKPFAVDELLQVIEDVETSDALRADVTPRVH